MRTVNLKEMISLSKALKTPAAEIVRAATAEDQLVVGAMLDKELDAAGFEVTYRKMATGVWCWVHHRATIEKEFAEHPAVKALWSLDSLDDQTVKAINGVPGLVARGLSDSEPDALRHAMLGWLREDAIREHDTGKHAKPIEVCLKCRAAAGQALPGIATRSSDPVVAAAAEK